MSQRRRAKGRKVNGILLCDKPLGVSSNAALQSAKNLYGAQKAGHTGSLDPLASGMLPLCFGEATKISQFLLDSDKYYRVVIKLGEKTASGDAEGEVIERWPVPEISDSLLEKVLNDFTGEIQQIPPMYSALKQKGQPLYKLARQGIEVEREARTLNILSLERLSFEGDSLELDVHCSKGTYVRTLAEDISAALGCGGGYITYLRRLKVGPFDGNMYSLETLKEIKESGDFEALDALLLPIDHGVSQWPMLNLSPVTVLQLRQGQPVFVANSPTTGLIRLYAEDDCFLGLGLMQDDGKIASKRLFN